MAAVWRDFRFALHTLRRTPATTSVAVATLALVIGANAAIFSLLNALLLRPLPIPQPEQLTDLTTRISDNVNGEDYLSLPMFREFARYQTVFSSLFAWSGGGISNLEADGAHYTASISCISGDYYKTMGIAPLLGRFIEPSDVALGSGSSNAVAVISYRIWRGWYRGDPAVLGKTIRLGDKPLTIIGVEPEGYSGLIIDGSGDVTVPLFAPGSYSSREPTALWLKIYGRMKPGVTLQQARAGLELLWPSIQKLTLPPGYQGERSKRFFARTIVLASARNGFSYLRKRFAHPLVVLLVLVGFLLLIACLNLANLSIAKMASQQHAWGVRRALGAGAWDLVRPLLMENFFVSVVAALLGLALAYAITPMLLHMAWTGLVETPLRTTPDLRVVAFTAAIATITALLFTIVPACYSTRADAINSLRQTTRSVHRGSAQLGRTLLTAQVALSLVLVTGAILFGKTLNSLHTVDAGYKRDHLLTLQLFPQPGSGKSQNFAAYYRELTDKTRALPGVVAVSYSNSGPANPFEGKRPIYRSPESQPIQAIEDVIGPDFFSTMGMRVLAGREFTWSDNEHSAQVAVVSQTLAERLYGSQNPIGQYLYWGVRATQMKLRIVGVVNSASLWNVETIQPMAVYRPLLQNPEYSDEPLMDVRTSPAPATLKSAAERVLRSFGRHYSLRTATLDERLSSFITVQRLTALLAGFFGAAALLIAAVGLYGLVSFHVTQRTRELGVRIALGAQAWQVLSMVLREVLFIAGAGCLLGLLASIALRSYVAGLVFGVSSTDPLVLASGILILMGVSVLAGFSPARRASGVDPAETLRSD
jgi:predicted permease